MSSNPASAAIPVLFFDSLERIFSLHQHSEFFKFLIQHSKKCLSCFVNDRNERVVKSYLILPALTTYKCFMHETSADSSIIKTIFFPLVQVVSVFKPLLFVIKLNGNVGVLFNIASF